MFEIFIPGVPQAQGRHRVAVVNGRPVCYDPKTSREWKQYIRLACAEKWRSKPLEGPVEIRLTFALPIPRSWSKKRKREALEGQIRPTKKPDIDNLYKSVVDALTGICWIDDKQIIEVTIKKIYSDQPGVTLTIASV